MASQGQRRVSGLSVPMLLIGLLLAQGLPAELRHWDALSGELRAFDVTMFVAAIALTASGAGLLIRRGHWRQALLAGAAASLVLAAGLILGTLTGVIPCAGPS